MRESEIIIFGTFTNTGPNCSIVECKYMKHIFELRMKDQIEERKESLKKIQA